MEDDPVRPSRSDGQLRGDSVYGGVVESASQEWCRGAMTTMGQVISVAAVVGAVNHFDRLTSAQFDNICKTYEVDPNDEGLVEALVQSGWQYCIGSEHSYVRVTFDTEAAFDRRWLEALGLDDVAQRSN